MTRGVRRLGCRRSLAASLAAALALVPAAAAQDAVSRFTLPNGLTVFLQPSPAVPLVALNIWYRVGAADDPAGRAGLSHLLEHLMFAGTARAPQGSFDRWLDAEGSYGNANTTHDRTAYFERMPRHALPLALWLEADRMAHMAQGIDSARLEREKEIVRQERREVVDGAPYGRGFELLVDGLFGTGHPYATHPLGRADEVQRVTLAELRDFHRRHYAPERATLAISGDFDADSMRALVTAWFGGIAPAEGRVAAAEPPALPAHAPAPRTRTVVDSVAATPGLFLGWRTVPAFHEDDAALDVLTQLLTGHPRARLRRALVDSAGIALWAEAAQFSARRVGFFMLSASLANGHSPSAARRVIERELRRIAGTGPTASELQRAKATLRSQLVDRASTVAGRTEQLNFYAFYAGDPSAFGDDLARYARVDVAAIRRAARRLMGAPAAVVLRPAGGSSQRGAQ